MSRAVFVGFIPQDSIIMSHPYAVRKPGLNPTSHEGSLLKRLIASLALLLGLTFLTLTLYLGNVETVAKALESYVVSFP